MEMIERENTAREIQNAFSRLVTLTQSRKESKNLKRGQ